MNTLQEEVPAKDDSDTVVISYLHKENEIAEQSLATAITYPHPTGQMLLASKLITHLPEAGLNPLVDAAGNLFSLMGKIRHIKWQTNLAKLHQELVQEIENFQQIAQVLSYRAEYIAEYIPITCYVLCLTLDDIISEMPWASQGKWNDYSLVATFIPEPPSQRSFFVILERMIRDPDIYIDIMELMYICLSFGFKCRNDENAQEFDYLQLEQITNSLYRRIRAYRGNLSRVLAPFPVKAKHDTVLRRIGKNKSLIRLKEHRGGILEGFFATMVKRLVGNKARKRTNEAR